MGKSDSWWFEHQEPARYQVRFDDPDWREPVVVWAKSPGDAADVALEYVDHVNRINAIGSPMCIERLAGPPAQDDVIATTENWSPPATPEEDDAAYAAFERHEARVDNLLKLVILGTPFVVGFVLGAVAVWLVA